MTIIESIKKVMIEAAKPLTDKEIYTLIKKDNLHPIPAKDPLHIVKTTIRRHCLGLDFPSSKKVKYFKIVENKRGSSKYFLLDSKNIQEIPKITELNEKDKLSEEIIKDEHIKHLANIKQDLLDFILNSEPSFFEKMVVELLLKMGYGWDDKESGIVSGGVNDGGIDGIIYEDQLQLSKIYIQAKKYTDKTIGRPEMQQFVGAMENNQKGVFITTSQFAKTAIDYIEKSSKNIALIDSEKLTELLVKNNLGISKVQDFTTYQIDRDYFDL